MVVPFVMLFVLFSLLLLPPFDLLHPDSRVILDRLPDLYSLSDPFVFLLRCFSI